MEKTYPETLYSARTRSKAELGTCTDHVGTRAPQISDISQEANTMRTIVPAGKCHLLDISLLFSSDTKQTSSSLRCDSSVSLACAQPSVLAQLLLQAAC